MTRISLLSILTLASLQESDMDKRIKDLVADLRSDAFDVREKAEKELIGLGRPARAAMKKLLKDDDPEVRARAAVVIREVEAKLRSKALRLEVATERKTYSPGEQINIIAKLKNVEDFPVTALRFIWDGGITADSWIREFRDGKEVNFAGDRLPQVMVYGDVDEDRFVMIDAKDSAAVREVRFKERWDLGEKDPSLKASYGDGWCVPLEPGKYRVVATYSAKGSARRLTFKGHAERLLKESWQGALETECEFTVESPQDGAKEPYFNLLTGTWKAGESKLSCEWILGHQFARIAFADGKREWMVVAKPDPKHGFAGGGTITYFDEKGAVLSGTYANFSGRNGFHASAGEKGAFGFSIDFGEEGKLTFTPEGKEKLGFTKDR